MSSMSRNPSNALMGFSVYQPAIGATLQFFPAMGSKQLDEMIDAYVPGDASISDKRAAVSLEFCQYTQATGDPFKFFMVYPSLGSAGSSPTIGSGYQSGLPTSPAMSESQWTNPSSRIASRSPSMRATSTTDLSHLPGMKIMTKDGRDVTNSASRGCKTKEQRDHAHLMRKIKACDSCRRKKTKCDPSHKGLSSVVSSGKVTKKTVKSSRPAAAPPLEPAHQDSIISQLDRFLDESFASFDSLPAESLTAAADGFSMEWDQFIQYDEESIDMIPYDFSPALAESPSSSSISPSRLPTTPTDLDFNISDNTLRGTNHVPLLPYLNPRGFEAGSNYVDFNLYSPQSSFLDEALDPMKEISASPIQSQRLDRQSHSSFYNEVIGSAEEISASPIQPQRLDQKLQSSLYEGVCHSIEDITASPSQPRRLDRQSQSPFLGGVLDLTEEKFTSPIQSQRLDRQSQSSLYDVVLGLVDEISASPIQRLDYRHRPVETHQEVSIPAATFEFAPIAANDVPAESNPVDGFSNVGDVRWRGISGYIRRQSPDSMALADAANSSGAFATHDARASSAGHAVANYSTTNTINHGPSIATAIVESSTSNGLATISDQTLSSPLGGRGRSQSAIATGRLRKGLALPDTREDDNSRIDTIVRIQTSSNDNRNVHPVTSIQFDMYRVPRSTTQSSAPSPGVVPNLPDKAVAKDSHQDVVDRLVTVNANAGVTARSSAACTGRAIRQAAAKGSHLDSVDGQSMAGDSRTKNVALLAIVNRQKAMNGAAALVIAHQAGLSRPGPWGSIRPLASQGPVLTMPCVKEPVLGNLTLARQEPVVTADRLLRPGLLSVLSIFYVFSALAAAALFTSVRTTVARGFIEGAKAVASSNVGYTAAFIISSLAPLCILATHLSSLNERTREHHPTRSYSSTTSPLGRKHSHCPSLWRARSACQKKFASKSQNYLTASDPEALGLVQCDFARKLTKSVQFPQISLLK